MLCESVVAKEYDDGNTVVAFPVSCKAAVSISKVVEVEFVRVGDVPPPFIGHLSVVVVWRNPLEIVAVVILENHQTIICKKCGESRFVDRTDQALGHQRSGCDIAAFAINAVLRLEVSQS